MKKKKIRVSTKPKKSKKPTKMKISSDYPRGVGFPDIDEWRVIG